MHNFTLNKLVLLFVFEKAEIPLQDSIISEIVASKNTWISYLECKQSLTELCEAGFILNLNKNPKDSQIYTITEDGRACLSHFYTKIPSSLREEIQEHIKNNLLEYRKKQEYFSDYYKNVDGTYTVVLKIISATQQPMIELKLNVPSRHTAKWIYKNWIDKAPQLYEMIYDLMVE